MVLTNRIRAYYRENPLMVSSPFGGVDGINKELFSTVLKNLAIDITGRNVLDVGCGRGYVSDFVKASGGRYTGVDAVSSRKGFRMALADSAALPFADSSFDIIFCVDAFEHFPDPAIAAREFHRVLQPAGCIFLSAPNYANMAGIVKWACETFGSYDKNTWAPFRRWQPQELEHALTAKAVRRAFGSAGFARFHAIGYGPEAGAGLFPWMEHAKMPEMIRFRLQRFFRWAGPGLVRIWPGASLHLFWKIET